MPTTAAHRRRVVVTGIGSVTPLGADVSATWQAATAGRCGIQTLDGMDERLSVKIGAPVGTEIDAGDLNPKDLRRFDRAMLLALAATREAALDADLAGHTDPDRSGVAIGSGIGGIGTLMENHKALLERGPRRVSPFFIPMTLANMPGGVVAIQHRLRGPNLCHVTACASGSHAIGEAARIIERGEADLMVAGGTEAALNELVMAGFASMQALSKRNEAPAQASRPFDRGRDGFVLGEGAAMLVLEAEEQARARGARIRATLTGYAASSDAAHMAAPDVESGGAVRCMEAALADADLSAADVDHINAHATSTPAGDEVEVASLRKVFGSHTDRIPVSATKGMTGHLLGAAGAVEAVLCVRALEEGLLPPTINLDDPDPACALDHVAGKARPAEIRVALSNSFGFGGVNAALVLQRWGT
ncbi:MAG: beta-ketoacyl-[acyl-carrier-protein] synthase II [Deltaproteobacteria bacterium]|jgi:3-oxoacyl-[acyl-carrier-protein] synthase II|nr:beta-ketoacyl-[acyl-carrier-protein] synthase II [Deltaproteobacteria bacterium]